MNVYIKTYGCQMNERDSESAAAMLVSAGHRIAGTEEEADIVILNTCSVREQAERKAIGKLGILKKLKRERPHMIFGIMGCMAQSRGAELLQSVDHLDFVVGTDNIHAIPEIVDEILRKKRKIRCDDRKGADTPGIDAHRVNTEQGQFSAFLSISRGCNRFCSYCIVPYVRGPERSRDMESIVAEARTLAEHGICEIMLLGQNVAAYGLDGIAPPIAEDNSPFSELLERVSEIDGIRRIRFTSPHPAFFNRKLIETIARLPKVCKCIHLPLQSGSDRVLKRMNRPYDAAHYMNIIRSLRELVPGNWCRGSTSPRTSLSDSPARRKKISRRRGRSCARPPTTTRSSSSILPGAEPSRREWRMMSRRRRRSAGMLFSSATLPRSTPRAIRSWSAEPLKCWRKVRANAMLRGGPEEPTLSNWWFSRRRPDSGPVILSVCALNGRRP